MASKSWPGLKSSKSGSDKTPVFKEAEGPTALRIELVQALSLSLGVVEIETAEGRESCRSGLVGVWNGKQGFVALIVRQLEHPCIRRWVYAEPISEQSQIMGAIEQGIDFAESLGLSLDDPAFTGLSDAARKQRIADWNNLRMLPQTPRAEQQTAAAPSRSARQAQQEKQNAESGAVLGRLSLVRKREDASLDPLARLLSYF